MRRCSSFSLTVVLLAGGALTHRMFAADLEKQTKNDAERILSGYKQDASALSRQEAGYSWAREAARVIPLDYTPQWLNDLRSQNFPGSQVRMETLEGLFLRALQHSTKIKVLSDTPLIQETGIREARGAFDTTAFVEGKYAYTRDPLASTLQFAGDPAPPNSYTAHEASLTSGVVKKFTNGAQVTLSERVSRLSDNSTQLDPDPQGTARLTLSIVQPLLRGAGFSYNLAGLNIAKIDSEIARREFIRACEDQLLEVNRAYWDLFSSRAVFQQRKRLVQETEKVVGQSEARKEVDVPQSQILRARSALAERKADLVRSEAAIRNAQDRILALINDPQLTTISRLELIPADALELTPVSVDLDAAACIALYNRPEIDQEFLLIREAAIREKVAKNEVMPTLNLMLEGYVAGVKADGDTAGALDRQRRDDPPGASVGFRFELPLENNIAKAHLSRQRIETRQRMNELRLTIETILLEIKVAVREVKISFRDMQAKYETVTAASADLRNLEARRTLILGFDEVSAINYMEYYLDSQDRESRAHEGLIQAVTNYRVALVALERAKGKLLTYKDMVRVPETHKKLPKLEIDPQKPLLRASVPLR